MLAPGKAAAIAALDTTNTQPPHRHVSNAPAAYSRGNLARLFVGRSEARELSQVEEALLGTPKFCFLPSLTS
jgi:hypothetical protein